jgi:hypothetical protein
MREWSQKPTVVLQASAASTLSTVSPLTSGIIVGVAGACLYGISNLVAFGKKKKTKEAAFKDTLKNSTGLGVAAGLALGATKAVAGSTIVLGSVTVMPIVTAVAVAYVTKRIWNRMFFKQRDLA